MWNTRQITHLLKGAEPTGKGLGVPMKQHTTGGENDDNLVSTLTLHLTPPPWKILATPLALILLQVSRKDKRKVKKKIGLGVREKNYALFFSRWLRFRLCTWCSAKIRKKLRLFCRLKYMTLIILRSLSHCASVKPCLENVISWRRLRLLT